MASSEIRDAAIREAKRYIRDIVRNDWSFEPTTGTAIGTGGPRFQTAWPISEADITEWRLREYDDSCSELEPQSPPLASPTSHTASSSSPTALSPGTAVELEERRRKRSRQMEEEMAWNEGLRTWMERRDAWAGARTRREIRARGEEMRRGSGAGAGATDGGIQEEATNDESTEVAAKAMTSLAIAGKDGKANGKDPGEEQDREDDKPTEPTNLTESEQLPEDSNHHHHHHDYNFEEDDEDLSDIPDEPYIPVVPSILAHTNPIRASITPSMYPSIYSKVIVQSLTPTVPINLADVTKAMVQGWKTDGTWPAKPPATSIVLPDTATISKKDRDDDHNRRRSGARAGGSSGSPENKRKSGVASAVRKVLHFSGFHPHHHPFHRRGSNHGGGHYNTHEEAGPSNPGHGLGHSER